MNDLWLHCKHPWYNIIWMADWIHEWCHMYGVKQSCLCARYLDDTTFITWWMSSSCCPILTASCTYLIQPSLVGRELSKLVMVEVHTVSMQRNWKQRISRQIIQSGLRVVHNASNQRSLSSQASFLDHIHLQLTTPSFVCNLPKNPLYFIATAPCLIPAAL